MTKYLLLAILLSLPAQAFATRTPVQTDNFTDNDLTIGSVAWDQLNAANAPLDNFSGVVTNQYSSDGVIRASGTYANDQYSKLALVTGINFESGRWFGVIARASADTWPGRDYYFFYISFAEGSSPFTYVLGKMVDDTPTTLKTGTAAFVVGDTIEIECEGTTIRGLINGILVDSATDATLASGKPGIIVKNSLIEGDNWEGGNLVAGGTRHRVVN